MKDNGRAGLNIQQERARAFHPAGALPRMKRWRESPSLTDLHETQGEEGIERGARWVWGGGVRGLPSALMHDDLLGHQGEAQGAKERKPKHLPFLHELTIAKPCVVSSPSHRRKRRERRNREGGKS